MIGCTSRDPPRSKTCSALDDGLIEEFVDSSSVGHNVSIDATTAGLEKRRFIKYLRMSKLINLSSHCKEMS